MKTRVTDPVLIEQCIRNLIGYNFDDELISFEETFSDYLGFNSQWSNSDMIEHIESIPGGTDHIFYSILVLKSYLAFDGNKSASTS